MQIILWNFIKTKELIKAQQKGHEMKPRMDGKIETEKSLRVARESQYSSYLSPVSILAHLNSSANKAKEENKKKNREHNESRKMNT